MNYQDYHSHPVNKFIHVICIPLIVLSSYILLSYIKVTLSRFTLELPQILILLLLCNYLFQSILLFFVMFLYFLLIFILSFFWRQRKNVIIESICVFIGSWIFQFFGHYIEGNRPALMDSLLQTFIEAPVFSLSYILPFKIH